MLRPRPYSGLSTLELRERAKSASMAEIDEIIYELGFRSRPAAKELLEELHKANGRAPSGAGASEKQQTREPAFGNERPRGSRTASPRPAFPPTKEQEKAVAAFVTGGSLKIAAFAGSGKTSTLQFMASKRSDRGIYLAFNRSIAEEARPKFGQNVDCRTTHAVAARQVGSLHNFSRSKMFDPMSANQLASILGLERTIVDGKVSLTPTQVAFLLLRTVKQFMRSANAEIAIEHVPVTGRLRGLDEAAAGRVRRWIVEQAKALWSRIINRDDNIPLGHDGYLKLWSLSNPRLDFSFILLDEAQDTNPVVLHVLTQQGHAQMVYVGDSHQQIYEWRGAINAMSKIETRYEVKLTQSFRFGPAIADAANSVLRTLGESERLRGCDQINSSIDFDMDTRAVLARTNAMVISEPVSEVLES